MGLKISALRFYRIEEEEGCVIVTFLIPADVADVLFTGEKWFTAEELQIFRSLSVLWLKCGDSEFIFENKVPGNTDSNDMKSSDHSISGDYYSCL